MVSEYIKLSVKKMNTDITEFVLRVIYSTKCYSSLKMGNPFREFATLHKKI